MTLDELVRAMVQRAKAVQDRIEAELRPRLPLTEQTLGADVHTAVGRVMHEVLESDTLFVGGGFVAEPTHFGGPLMSWWQALGNREAITRLDAGATGGGDYLRSYDEIEWFAVPRDANEPHMTGPYVDYLCTDDATITFTRPLSHEGEFFGVVGADFYLAELEQRVIGALRETHERAVLITDEQRVAVSCDPDVFAMTRAPFGRDVRPIEDTPFLVSLPVG